MEAVITLNNQVHKKGFDLADDFKMELLVMMWMHVPQMISVRMEHVLEPQSFATPPKDALKMPLAILLLDVMILASMETFVLALFARLSMIVT
jgi:hypothetical protein